MEKYKYLCNKYIELGFMERSGEHTIDSVASMLDGFNLDGDDSMGWDPFIYPDNGHIPECSVCKKVYATFREDVTVVAVQMRHRKMCLWHDYFVEKIKMINPVVEFKYIS